MKPETPGYGRPKFMKDRNPIKSKGYSKLNLLIAALLMIQLISNSSFPVIDPANAIVPTDEDSNQGGNGTGDFLGNWYIDSGQTITRANQTLNLTGNLIINSSARLVLTNFTLKFINTFNGEHNLFVRDGGTLELLDNSTITANTTAARFEFIVEPGGTVVLDSSVIEYCGWDQFHPGLKLEFASNNTAPTNSSINLMEFNNSYAGITVINQTGNLSVENSSFFNSGIGIRGLNSTSFSITNNTIEGCGYGIVLNASSENAILSNNIKSNFNSGISVRNSENISITNNTISNNGFSGLDLLNNSKIYVVNNNLSGHDYGIYTQNSSLSLRGDHIFNNSQWGIYSAGTSIDIDNETFTSGSGSLPNNFGKLWQQYYLSVQVKDSSTLMPLPAVNVTIMDRYDVTVSSVITEVNGFTPLLNLTSFQELNDNTSKTFTPHNVTVEKSGFDTGFSDPEVNMSADSQIILYLDPTPPPPTVDYVTIERTPGGVLDWAGPRNYSVGESEQLYCIGYNQTYGYVGEVNASWIVTDTTLASVFPSEGNFTTLSIKTVLTGGTFSVSTNYAGLTNASGLLTVLPATEDYIVISSAPNGTGSWVGPHLMPLYSQETFYCAVYNTTGGYLFDGNASWLTGNPYISSINNSGTFTQLSAQAEGTTYAEAVYTASYNTNLTNQTGTITIEEFTVDTIIIRTEPSGSGTWVGPRTYQNVQSVKFYCAAYNTSWGYLYDVTASWAVFGDDIGWLSSYSSSDVELFITNEGSAYITAGAKSLTNSTGLLKILAPLPDLAITTTDITFSPSEQPFEELIPVTIQIKVSNQGGAIETSTVLAVYDIIPPDSETVLVESITMNAFNSFESRYFNITWHPEGIGTHSLIFFLDEQNILTEHDESNNFIELVLEVKKYIPDLTKINIEPEDSEVKAGEVLQFQARGTFENGTARILLPHEVQWFSSGGAKIKSTGDFYSLKMGIYNVSAAAGRITNETGVTVVAGPLELIEVRPNPYEIEVGMTVKFTAYGYDEYYNQIYILPDWNATGGGNITIDGEFTASQEGQWKIFAEFMGVSGNATIRVFSSTLDLNRIMVFPSKVVIVKGEEFKMFAIGVDGTGNEHVLTPHWTHTGGGTFSSTGLFNASTVGRWMVKATQGGISGSAEVIVSNSAGELHQESFEDPRTGVTATASFAGSGTVWINKLDNIQSLIKPPSNFIVAGAYFDITVSDNFLINWISISLPYNPGSIPAESQGLTEKLKIYYWSEPDREWLPCENNVLDDLRYTITCNVTHLSIFAPLIEKDRPAPEPEEETGFNYSVLGIVIAIILILFIVGFWLTARLRPELMEKIPGGTVFVRAGGSKQKPQRSPQIRKIVIVRRQMPIRKKDLAKTEESKLNEDELEE